MSFTAVPTGRPAPLPELPHPTGTLPRGQAEALLSEYRSGIYSFLRRKGFSAEEADDLTQETLIRAYLHLSGFRGLSMGAWLYRIAANVSIDYLRKQRLATVPLENVPLAGECGEDPTARLDRTERGARLLAVISELPECHRRILRMRYYEDRSLAEIAAEIHCTPMAAKLRVFRAVTALRKRWRSLALDSDLIAG
jgi:RNA polymerase sigma-70 factor (ECF subfamily)